MLQFGVFNLTIIWSSYSISWIRKNRNPVTWGILGFIFNIAAMGIIPCLRPGNYDNTKNTKENTSKEKSKHDPSLLDTFKVTDFVKNNSIVDVLGVFAAVTIAVGVIVTYLHLGGVPGIILCLITAWKFNAIRRHFNIPGFGKGVLIYVAFIIIAVPLAFMTIINSLSMLGRDWHNIVYAIGLMIFGFVVLPKMSNNAKKATPFLVFLFSAGLSLLLLQIRNNSHNSSVGDAVTANNTDITPLDAGTVTIAHHSLLSDPSSLI